MQLSELIEKKEIGIRAHNICEKAKISSVENLISYLNHHKRFSNIDNCDIEIENELIKLCLKYGTIVSILKNPEVVDLTQNNHLESSLSSISYLQIQVINQFIREESEKLSTRARNALDSIVGNNLTLPVLVNTVFENPSFKIKLLHKVGKKTIDELQSFFTLVKQQIELFVKSGKYH